MTQPDAAWLYDWECRHVHHRHDQDVGFWLELARRCPGPVLELACGTGRVTGPLAETGLSMVGLDRDHVMLAALARRCRPLARPPMTVAADMRGFALAARFGAIFVAYNSIQLLQDPAGMVACMSSSRRHLAIGGYFGAEVTDFQAGGSSGVVGEEVLAEADGIRLSGSLEHDLARRTSKYRRCFTGAGWAATDEVVLRSLDRRELAGLLHAAGLEPISWLVEGATTRFVAETV